MKDDRPFRHFRPTLTRLQLAFALGGCLVAGIALGLIMGVIFTVRQ